MSLLKIEPDKLTIDGEEFYLACGDFQYFRTLPSEWKHRLEVMKDFGLNTVQTYCPWNLHEPREGVFDFDGLLDLAKFLEVCAEVGMKVLLRPSPYICGEWDFGALPWWLLKDRHMHVRCSYAPFLDKVDAYYARLSQEFLPYLSTKGGPIIAVCIENEYGTVSDDAEYMAALMKMLEKYGVDVPFYLTDCTFTGLSFTKELGIWSAVNYRIESDTAVPRLQKLQPDKRAFVGEYWSGRSVTWGEDGSGREVAPIAKAYRKALDLGAYLSFYMFTGGTNFGFMNGGRVLKPFNGKGESVFRPICTSYNCDALISEEGRATEKYYACRAELDGYLGKETRTDKVPDPEVQTASCELTETAPVFENLDALGKSVKSVYPMTFEELDCPWGYVLYSCELPYYDGEVSITIDGLCDRAIAFIDGERVGEFRRDVEQPKVSVHLGTPHRLDLLVESLGHANGRPRFAEEKGILGEVKVSSSALYHFECRPFSLLAPIDGHPFDIDLSGVKFGTVKTSNPRFLRGKFAAKAGISTNLSLEGLGSGCAIVNGFNIGRYLDCGPQRTLYVPGELLKDGENELVLLELSDKDVREVDFVADAIYAGEFKAL